MRNMSFSALDTAVHISTVMDSETAVRALHSAYMAFSVAVRALDAGDAAGELAEINRSPGWPVRVSPSLFRALRASTAAAAATQYFYTPLVVVNAERWAGHAGSPRYTRPVLGLDATMLTVTVPVGTRLHLRGIQLGLAADLAMPTLQAAGGAAIEAGGLMRVLSPGPGGGEWQHQVAEPGGSRKLVTVTVRDGAACTRVAAEARTDVLLATVITGSAASAEAMARALLVAGSTDGMRLLETLGIPGLLALATGKVEVSSHMWPHLRREDPTARMPRSQFVGYGPRAGRHAA